MAKYIKYRGFRIYKTSLGFFHVKKYFLWMEEGKIAYESSEKIKDFDSIFHAKESIDKYAKPKYVNI